MRKITRKKQKTKKIKKSLFESQQKKLSNAAKIKSTFFSGKSSCEKTFFISFKFEKPLKEVIFTAAFGI